MHIVHVLSGLDVHVYTCTCTCVYTHACLKKSLQELSKVLAGLEEAQSADRGQSTLAISQHMCEVLEAAVQVPVHVECNVIVPLLCWPSKLMIQFILLCAVSLPGGRVPSLQYTRITSTHRPIKSRHFESRDLIVMPTARLPRAVQDSGSQYLPTQQCAL